MRARSTITRPSQRSSRAATRPLSSPVTTDPREASATANVAPPTRMNPVVRSMFRHLFRTSAKSGEGPLEGASSNGMMATLIARTPAHAAPRTLKAYSVPRPAFHEMPAVRHSAKLIWSSSAAICSEFERTRTFSVARRPRSRPDAVPAAGTNAAGVVGDCSWRVVMARNVGPRADDVRPQALDLWKKRASGG